MEKEDLSQLKISRTESASAFSKRPRKKRRIALVLADSFPVIHRPPLLERCFGTG